MTVKSHGVIGRFDRSFCPPSGPRYCNIVLVDDVVVVRNQRQGGFLGELHLVSTPSSIRLLINYHDTRDGY